MSDEPWVRINERTWKVPSYPPEAGHSRASVYPPKAGHSRASVTVKVLSTPGRPMTYPLRLILSDGDERVGELILSKREVLGLVQVLLDAMAQADDPPDH